MPEPQKRLQVDPWGSLGFQRQGSLWWQGSHQRGDISSGPLLRLSSQRRRGRGGGGPYGGLRRPLSQVGTRQLALVLQDVPHLLHLTRVRAGDAWLRSKVRRGPLRRDTSGSDGGRQRIRPREAPRSRRSHSWGWSGWRQSMVGQVAVRQQRNDRLSERWPWRLRGAAVSAAAAVQGDAVVVEPGPQSLDVNVLLLRRQTGVRKLRMQSLCFLKQEVSRRARHCPPPTPHPRANKPAPSLPPPPCAIFATTHVAAPLPAAHATGGPPQ